jgi:nucleoside-diphosphate-sugar epimerase
MEEIIQQNSSKYLIFRLPNVIGNTGNKSNLINFLANKIKNHQQFQLWTKARRRIIDIKDVVSCISDYLLAKPKLNSIVNLAPAFDTEVIEIISILERIYQTKARFTEVDRGNRFNISIKKMRTILNKYGLLKPSNYVEKVVRKYYE